MSQHQQETDEEAAPLQLHDAPPDVAVTVLLRLSLRERARCACVCRAWRALVALPAVWLELDVRGVSLSTAALRAIAARAQGGLVSLCASHVSLRPALALEIAQRNPSLATLRVEPASTAGQDEEEHADEAADDAWRPEHVAALLRVKRLAAAISVAALDGVAPLLSCGRLGALRVERARLNADGARLLADAALQAPASDRVHSLHLRWNAVGSQGCRHLARLVAEPGLSSLHLGWNDVGNDGARALALALQARTLHHDGVSFVLDLRHNGVGAEGARCLAAALSGGVLTSLCLLHNHISPDGAVALGAALEHGSCALTSLDASYNDIGVAGVAAFNAKALRRLRSLRLAFNGLCADSARLLAHALAHNSSLQLLDVGFNALTDEGVRELCVSLRSHPALRELIMPVTAMGPEGARRVGGLLRNCATLRSLDVSGNALGRTGGAAIATGLAEGGGAMRELTMRTTRVDDTAAYALADALRSKGGAHMAALDLSGCLFGDDGARALAAACRAPSSALVTLNVHNTFIGAADTGAAALRAAVKARAGRLTVVGLPDAAAAGHA